MLPDLDLIRHLEAVADRAWPPGQVHELDGWQMLVTGPGIGRRVNCVAPLAAGVMPLEDKVAAAEAFYQERGLAPIFKLTRAAQPPGLEEFLEARGYRVDAPVVIMTRALEPEMWPGDLPAAPTPDWLAANAAVPSHYGAAPEAFLALIGRIRPPKGFAAVQAEDGVAAVGMAVADGEWVGLFEIGTIPACRRRGLARQVVERLLAWGAARGAERAHLQVMEANTAARALYAGLGFTEAYRYWYRVGG